ncbi:hypothetical protein GF420_10530 [candidate division GN15 bacterium]|nr:hypothetical protein [candidate division GN15 bacterium]
MRLTRVVIAVLITLVLLYVARNTSRGRPDDIIHTDHGYTFSLTTVPKITVGATDTLTVSISPRPDQSQRVVYRTTGAHRGKKTPFDEYTDIPAALIDSLDGMYGVPVTAGERGKREYYVFEVVDTTGATIARLTTEKGEPLFVKYIGEVPAGILVPHIVFMFVTVFCVVLGAVHALRVIRTGQHVHGMSFWITLGMLATLIGGYPFGFGMNWYAFGVVWEGVPFGTDATDNKTQLLFVYFVFVTLASLGSLTKGRYGRDTYPPRALGWFGLGAFVLMLAIYLIPHSIQFSATLTYTVCYGFIAFVLGLYLFGRLRYGRRAAEISDSRTAAA